MFSIKGRGDNIDYQTCADEGKGFSSQYENNISCWRA